MKIYPRVYEAILREHLAENRQMAFVSGPRQVGKTTLCRAFASTYFNWDDQDARGVVLKGPSAVAEVGGLDRMAADRRVLVFDELHRYARWKTFLKGFFDVYGDAARVIVTGSSRLDVFRLGGDSLMGRYFPYRMHPFSVAELVRPERPTAVLRPPAPLDGEEWAALWTHGGYPEPFTRRNDRFSTRWQGLRQSQLLREDIREMTRIQEIDQLVSLAALLGERSGGQVVYASLAGQVRVSENTVRHWIGALAALHYGFLVRPWHRRVAHAIRKEPKWYLRDWAAIRDPGQRAETFVACHLLKAVEGWTDLGFGRFELAYVRDKRQREVDFLVLRDRQPWFLVEVKSAADRLSPALALMQEQTGAEHAFQAILDADFIPQDCFHHRKPVIVPARTLLSQLL